MSEAFLTRRREAAITRFAVRLGHLFRNAAVYPPGHQARALAFGAMCNLASQVFERGGHTRLHIVGAKLFAGSDVLRPPRTMSRALRELTVFLGDRGVGGVEVLGAPSLQEVEQFVDLLVDEPGGGGPGHIALNEAFAQAGIEKLRLLGLRSILADDALGSAADRALVCARVYLRGVRGVQRLHQRGISAAVLLELRRVASGLVDLWGLSPAQLLTVSRPSDALPPRYKQPVDVAVLATGLGRRLRLADAVLNDLTLTAITASCGASRLPTLPAHMGSTRSGHSNATEQALLDGQAYYATRIMLDVPQLSDDARRRLLVGFEHQMGMDRSGRPCVAWWPPLHPFSRIIAAASTWVMLRNRTPQRAGLSVRQAVDALRGAASAHLDPTVVEHLTVLVSTPLERDGEA